MTQLTIRIADHVARRLENVAAEQNKSVEQVAVDSLSDSFPAEGSPAAILRVLRGLPHVDAADIEDLDQAIKSGRLPVREKGIFEE